MPTVALYTVGHSNQEMDELLSLLDQHHIEVLVDVRSAPYSRWVPEFGKASLEQAISTSGREYVYMGQELGGLPDHQVHADLYGEDGHVLYYKVARLPWFQAGILDLKRRMATRRVAIMCSEEDPRHCHRRLLIGRVITQDGGIELRHIRRGGAIEAETTVLLDGEGTLKQTSLFGDINEQDHDTRWRSTRSASPARRRKNSSES